MKQTAKIAVLVSGGGTNLEALIRAQDSGKLISGKIVLVIADRNGAYAIERAQKHAIPTAVVPRKECASQEEFELRLDGLIRKAGADLVILAGFLSILSADFTSGYPRRIINVHPSLIPSFCGKGYYGLKVHAAALERGVKLTGATVHFVNEIPDGGEIILQKAVKIKNGDTPETLQKRVMREAEWKILPAAAETVCAEMVRDLQKRGR